MLRDITEEDLSKGLLISVDTFNDLVMDCEIDDSDGYALLVYEGQVNPKKEVAPSDAHNIPEDVTDVLWFRF